MSDLISKQAVLDRFQKICKMCGDDKKYNGVMCRACYFEDAIDIVDGMEPVEQPEIIRCTDCKYWDRLEDGHPYGYCLACRSGTHTDRWEISIYRQNRFDFFCADAEPKESEDDDE